MKKKKYQPVCIYFKSVYSILYIYKILLGLVLHLPTLLFLFSNLYVNLYEWQKQYLKNSLRLIYNKRFIDHFCNMPNLNSTVRHCFYA